MEEREKSLNNMHHSVLDSSEKEKLGRVMSWVALQGADRQQISGKDRKITDFFQDWTKGDNLSSIMCSSYLNQ